MKNQRFPILLALLLGGLLLASAAFSDEDPRLGGWMEMRLTGTWMAYITVPPHPLLGNSEPVVLPEMVTFLKGGGVITTSSQPAFPFPTDDGGLPALMSNGHANWARVAPEVVRATHWRFLNDPTTGALLGFVKIYIEGEMVSRDEIVGIGSVHLLHPDLSPVELMGEPLVIDGCEVTWLRVPVEPMP